MRFHLKVQNPGEFDHEAVWGSMALALLATAILYPFDRYPLVVCWFHNATGIPCPSCGATRAFVQMIHGHFVEGFAYNPLGAVFFIACAAFVPYAIFAIFAKKRRLRFSLDPRDRIPAVILILLLIAANWAYLVWAKKI